MADLISLLQVTPMVMMRMLLKYFLLQVDFKCIKTAEVILPGKTILPSHYYLCPDFKLHLNIYYAWSTQMPLNLFCLYALQ